ncbi:MAG: hypothetical protein LAT67_05035 [Balneolales bacterium]|nr:hypothetical protein [Balneolales bacterium]
MMECDIENEELLFRGVTKYHWDFKRKRVSSAFFIKQNDGVSVDRQHKRHSSDCIKFVCSRFKNKFLYVASMKTQSVRESGAYVCHTPLIDNEYHSSIFNSEERDMIIAKPKAKKLLKLISLTDCIE